MTPSEVKGSDSSDSRKNIYYFYVLTCSVDSFGFLFFSFFFFLFDLPLPRVVVADFIGTMKSNLALELFLFFPQSHFLLFL